MAEHPHIPKRKLRRAVGAEVSPEYAVARPELWIVTGDSSINAKATACHFREGRKVVPEVLSRFGIKGHELPIIIVAEKLQASGRSIEQVLRLSPRRTGPYRSGQGFPVGQ